MTSITLTSEMVRIWVKDRDRLRAELAELDRKIQAAEVLGVVAKGDDATGADRRDRLQESVTKAIRRVLVEEQNGLNAIEIAEWLVRRGFDASRFGTNRSYLYTSLARLEKRGLIQKKGEKYFPKLNC